MLTWTAVRPPHLGDVDCSEAVHREAEGCVCRVDGEDAMVRAEAAIGEAVGQVEAVASRVQDCAAQQTLHHNSTLQLGPQQTLHQNTTLQLRPQKTLHHNSTLQLRPQKTLHHNSTLQLRPQKILHHNSTLKFRPQKTLQHNSTLQLRQQKTLHHNTIDQLRPSGLYVHVATCLLPLREKYSLCTYTSIGAANYVAKASMLCMKHEVKRGSYCA